MINGSIVRGIAQKRPAACHRPGRLRCSIASFLSRFNFLRRWREEDAIYHSPDDGSLWDEMGAFDNRLTETEEMSLYNALFGTNPYANALLMVLGTRSDAVPRYRDCYLNEAGEIVIFTRTGGGNRAHYENAAACKRNYPELFVGIGDDPAGPWNDDLRALPDFIRDEDDAFDSTYALFYFQPPAQFAEDIEQIKQLQGEHNPMASFQQLLADLRDNKDTPATRKALEVGKTVFRQLASGKGGIIEI